MFLTINQDYRSMKKKPKFTNKELMLQAQAKEQMEKDIAKAESHGVTLSEYRLLKAIFNDPEY